jgi:hypothetical protein
LRVDAGQDAGNELFLALVVAPVPLAQNVVQVGHGGVSPAAQQNPKMVWQRLAALLQDGPLKSRDA